MNSGMLRVLAFCASPFALAVATGADLRLTGALPLLGFLLFWASPVPAVDTLGRVKANTITRAATILMLALVLVAFGVALMPVVS